jgi:Fic family protein
MPNYQPPFTLTPELLGLVADIAEQIGRLTAQQTLNKSLELRRINRIRTIQGSLAIEGNTLTEAQITAILEGKRVLAPPRDIQEAQNALSAYEQLFQWQPHHEPHLLAAHAQMMTYLMTDAGHYRSGGVGVMAGNEVIHMAPPAKQVPKLMADLLGWLAATPLHPLISSSIFHYEFEFIHPFADGNGRMGRLWQTLILSRWNELFAYLPVESLVHVHQAEYYQAIQQSTDATDCAPFIHFMLKAIHAALLEAQPDTHQKGSEKSSEKDTEISSEKILALIAKDTRISAKALAEKLGVSSRTIEKQLAKLKARGKLSRIGAAKGGHWQVNNNLKN